MRTTALVAGCAALLLPLAAPAGVATTIVAEGVVIEECDGLPPREVPFSATVHVPRASWPDQSFYGHGGDLSTQLFTKAVTQNLRIGDRVFTAPAQVNLLNPNSAYDSRFEVAMGAGDEYFRWTLRGVYFGESSGYPIKITNMERVSDTSFWLFSRADGSSKFAGCVWRDDGSPAPSAVHRVTYTNADIPDGLSFPLHSICTAESAFFYGGTRVHTGGYPGSSPTWLARIKTGARLIAVGDAALEGTALVGGNLIIQDEASLMGASVAGMSYVAPSTDVGPITAAAPFARRCDLGFDVDAALASAANKNDNDRLVGMAGFNGHDLSLNGETVFLPAGRFHFRNLLLRNGSRLVTPGDGVAEVYVGRMMKVETGSVLGRQPLGEIPGFGLIGDLFGEANSLVVVSGARLSEGTNVTLSNARLIGHLIAPYSPVYISDETLVAGSLTALEVEMADTIFRVMAPLETAP